MIERIEGWPNYKPAGRWRYNSVIGKCIAYGHFEWRGLEIIFSADSRKQWDDSRFPIYRSDFRPGECFESSPVKRTITHMCVDIRGMLRNHKDLSGMMTNDDGSDATHDQAVLYLNDCLNKGWKVIPMSKKCEGFDYQKGCPGHPIIDEYDTMEAYGERS